MLIIVIIEFKTPIITISVYMVGEVIRNVICVNSYA